MIVFLMFICLAINMLAAFGVLVTLRRDFHPSCFVSYGVLLFFLGFIPLIAEGDSLTRFGRIPDAAVSVLCDLPPDELRRSTDKYTYELIAMAHRFDDLSQLMLDRYMCTDTCPCMKYTDDMLSSQLNE